MFGDRAEFWAACTGSSLCWHCHSSHLEFYLCVMWHTVHAGLGRGRVWAVLPQPHRDGWCLSCAGSKKKQNKTKHFLCRSRENFSSRPHDRKVGNSDVKPARGCRGVDISVISPL